jgi:hypothetical protein
MAIVAGFDVHRRQITFDALDTETGEVSRGRIDATPAAVAGWVRRFNGQALEVEACTGWLFVCDALVSAGAVPHLAEPVETRALRGRKRRAKTDREDARWLPELLADGRLRSPGSRLSMCGSGVRGGCVTLAMVDAIEQEIAPLERELRQLARRQTGCRALMGLYGMGELTSLITLRQRSRRVGPAAPTTPTTSRMAFTLPAGSRSFRGSHPKQVAAHQRLSGRSHSTRTDRSTIMSPTTTRSRTQISPGIHGAGAAPQSPQPLATPTLDTGPSSDTR